MRDLRTRLQEIEPPSTAISLESVQRSAARRRRNRRVSRVLFGAVGFLVVLVVSSIVLRGDPSTTASEKADDAGVFVVMSASSRLPSETLEDIVTYADAVAVLRVAGTEQLPPSPLVDLNGEGIVGKRTEYAVESVLWENSNTTHPDLPDQFSVVGAGWALKDGKLTPVRAQSSTHDETGDRVVAVLSYFSGGWGQVAPTAVYSLDGDVLLSPAGYADRYGVAFVDRVLDGLTTSEIETLLASTSPDPRAATLSDLEPEERFLALVDEQE